MSLISLLPSSRLWLHSLLVLAAIGLATNVRAVTALDVRLATFRADMTPPIGPGPCVGFMPRVESVEHPLELRGIVVELNGERLVIAALDYQGLCNSSDDSFRRRLAEAAGTTPERVAVQSLHQHTAPVLDADAVRVLYGRESAELRWHLEFTDTATTWAAEAVRGAMTRLVRVERILVTRARVDRVASNRRVPQADGTLAVRGSSTRDPRLQAAPEGLIDPWLRTVTLIGADRPLAQLHFYATHPQSFYGDGRITWDVPGIARERWERESGIFQIYFNGCGGNVGMGKYNDGSRSARDELAARLHDAMCRATPSLLAPGPPPEQLDAVIDVARLAPRDVAWDTIPLAFTVRDDGPFKASELHRQLEAKRPFSERLKAAMFVAWSERLRAGHRVTVSRWKLGPLQIVHLPGEPFVEFQLFAQQLAGDRSVVCVAGYGECGVWYYGPDAIYTDRGGYEQSWSFSGPCQQQVESVLRRLVAAEK